MAIEKKLIHFGRLADFNTQLNAGNILDRSIVFIQDAKKIWTHGTFYDCSGSGAASSDVYVTDFTVEDLRILSMDGGGRQSNVENLIDAINAGKEIRIPVGNVEGYAPCVAYVDDMVYIEIFFYSRENISVEIPVSSALDEILSEYITIYDLRTQPDWNETDSSSDAYIKNKPTIPTKTSQLENDSKFASSYSFGDLPTVVNAPAFDDDTYIYAFPTSSTGDEDDVIATKNTLKTINGESILGEGDLITDIVVSSVEELDSLDVPIGTKARIFNYTSETVYGGLNLGRIFFGTETNPLPPDFGTNPNYTFNIEVDTSVMFPYDENAEHVRIELPTNNRIAVYINSSYDSIREIRISVGYFETMYNHLTGWGSYAQYLRSIFLGDVGGYSEEQLATLLAISPALNGSITNPATTISNGYVKSSEGWIPANNEVIKSLYNQFNTQFTYLNGRIPTKTSQLENDSNFVSSDGLKTINGESIVGSGNITISGGSSSGGSGAYSEVNHGTADTTFTLTPNTFHVWDEVASLTLDFGSETSGVANEFLFQFTSGATATSLTLPDDIKWANDSAPTIAENMIYQVSVLRGLASLLEFSNNNSVMPITLYAVNSSGGSSYTNPPSDNPNANKLYEELMSLSNNTGQGNLDVGLVTLVLKIPGTGGTTMSYDITSYSLAPSYISEGILLLKQGYSYYVLQQDGTIQSIFYD